MAKDDVVVREKKEKKDKDKKRKHSEPVGDEMEVEVVAERKKKKDKKRKDTDATTAVLNTLESSQPGAVAIDADGDVIIDAAAGADVSLVKDEDESEEKKVVVKGDVPLAALVPFANPLCDEKNLRKVLKSVKKAAKHRALKRGVKESVKHIRKSPLAAPTTDLASAPPVGIVILAADISPMDVISHIPVLCEDHNIPYLYVPSRAELGAAGGTKRPTSIVIVMPKAGKDAEGAEEYEEVFKELWKLSLKMGQFVKV